VKKQPRQNGNNGSRRLHRFETTTANVVSRQADLLFFNLCNLRNRRVLLPLLLSDGGHARPVAAIAM
jgi:hypothetical protein